jgi:type IV pilus assembly protein PilM
VVQSQFIPLWIKERALFLRWWKQRKTESLVGLDISSNFIKLLKIKSTETPFRVENYAIAPLPVGAIIKDEIKDSAAISNALREVVKQAGINVKEVALAIPRSSAIIKNITVDSRLNSAEIESRAWIEANRHFPDLVGDIYLDFVITGTSVQEASQLDMILVACRKEIIKPYVEVIRQAGLNAKIIDVDCYALERTLQSILLMETPSTNSEDIIALLNLDTTVSSLVVLQEKHLIYSHDNSYDNNRLITQVHNYIEKAAGKDLENDEGYLALLKENLSAHLRHTMHFFYSSRPNIGIQKMYLAGDCATLPHLTAFLQKETNIETMVANPFMNMNIAPEINADELKQHAPALMLCYGLALSKFNTK